MSEAMDMAPDHRLESSDIQPTGEGPRIYAVADLKAYVKPDLDEELSAPLGGPATCGTEVICTCVPVETCACNTVSYRSGGSSCPGDCSCIGNCVNLYWYPY